ncbi:hypothetical protein ACRTAL_002538 [Clostridium perfringens]|uniref:Uncharacterized protein n=2 Tax=Clostridium perfringens TaxID=1502 RepID=A0A2X3AAI9_CLOPF|nr:hypothetical protein [Clostridium perfringens]EDT15602.1 hypothetical protein AC3_2774 [Clostridium perfringens E str. JGS1987]ALG49780.1 hypothetical protein FORC3_2403 [Clostridium perfringens]AXH53371.1 hypothetical protein C8114_12260 [Clostridium perfringens]EDS79782.1 hypothetical protein CPC_2489 [Clostridium perfringens C str. JGS1495]EHK2306900.1 hypothetical protein [Clostridium perfringens]
MEVNILMNKGLLSFLVLFFTTLIMGAMTYFVNLNYEEAKLKAESIKNQRNEILNINEEENGQKAIENNKEELKEDREKENISENNNKQSNDLDKSQLKEEKEIEGKSKENATNIKKNEKSKEKVAEEKSSKESKEVFKVDKYSIPKKINKADKFKLMSIAKNLSLTDYGVLLEHIKRNDELDAAIDIFKILKDKLEEKEYKEMKDILSPYINIELIEEKI